LAHPEEISLLYDCSTRGGTCTTNGKKINGEDVRLNLYRRYDQKDHLKEKPEEEWEQNRNVQQKIDVVRESKRTLFN
jgi:hypothetical protein